VRNSRVWHILASPGYATGTIAVNVTWFSSLIGCDVSVSVTSKKHPIYTIFSQRYPQVITHHADDDYKFAHLTCIMLPHYL